MKHCYLEAQKGRDIPREEVHKALLSVLEGTSLRRVLLLPPDISRLYSCAGPITAMLYNHLAGKGVKVDIMPALGSHVPMTDGELEEMFPGVPKERFLVHNWRTDTVRLGEIPATLTAELSEGLFCEPVPVEINRRVVDKSYDLVISVGQVVPHEVVGIANYNKNLFVGCGGAGMINASHYMGALYGMERMMGRDHSPVRKLFDYAQDTFLGEVPLLYVLTVTSVEQGNTRLHCLSAGDTREAFERAVKVCQQVSIACVDRPVRKIVAYMEPGEYKRTWIANKAIYRTRMLVEDGGEILIIAPGLQGCGEDREVDRLLRKYGYVGRDRILELTRKNRDLQENLSVAAHIIHSSTDGRFSVTYAPGHMTRQETEGISYKYMPLEEALERYPVEKLSPGFQTVDGEEIYFIPNPATGLWARKSLYERIVGR